MGSVSVGFFHGQILPPMADMTQEIVDELPSGQHGLIGGVSLIGHRLSRNAAYPFSSTILPLGSLGGLPMNNILQELNSNVVHEFNSTLQEFNSNVVHEINTCSQQSVANKDIYQYDEAAYQSDEDYLKSKMSRLSYWEYMKDDSHRFLRTRHVLLYHTTCF